MIEDAFVLLPLLAADIGALTKETTRAQQNLDAMQVEISEVERLLLQHAPGSDLALDFRELPRPLDRRKH